MNGKKLIFLIAALLLPVAVFLFLKMFGRNEFRVPPLHQEGDISAPSECDYVYPTPYILPDSIADQLEIDNRDSLYIIWFDPKLNAALKRVSDATVHASLRLLPPVTFQNRSDLNVLQRCVLLMKPPASVVMVDHKRRIRGYYDAGDREEMDRLQVEIDIILKNY